MKQRHKIKLTDRTLDDRIATLHRGLSTLADRHCQLLDDLRPIAPGKWPEEPTYPTWQSNPIVIQ